ncbi:peptide transporter family 1 [Trichonephila inaurata madagascariensis]|uniref:Peptide transporter family 1 n=1 Tax=Trichonephila inaurata madagascariensis TaxID=2747483 RepID=A0A8X6YB77_9ARAC|nr:peptide transporter family 1 [Trichonephila inaurata madagascariensis]
MPEEDLANSEETETVSEGSDTKNEKKEKKSKTKKQKSKQKRDDKDKKNKKESKAKDENSKKKGDKKSVPKAIKFLLVGEFGEKYCFFSIRTVLTLFLTQHLLFGPNAAAKLAHFFKMNIYILPLFGALLADSYLGKFNVIFLFSILTSFGNIILTMGSMAANLYTMRASTLFGLLASSIGIGAIRPCITALGGDQYGIDEAKHRLRYFSVLYFVMSVASLFATAIAPVLRFNVACFDQLTCFPLPFFVSSMIFIISFSVFLFHKPLFVIKPAQGSVFLSVFRCMVYALKKKRKAKNETKEHWLDYAEDKYSKDVIYDIKCLLRLLFIYIPLPVFWSLFDQQSSRWIFQAVNLNGELNGHFIRPDQLLIVNPLVIILFLPLFEYIIYPFLGKLKLCRTPLQRMTVGGILAACSFIMAGILQLRIESEVPPLPPKGFTEVLLINNSPCTLRMESPQSEKIRKFDYSFVKSVPLKQNVSWDFVPSNCSAEKSKSKTFYTSSAYQSVMVTLEDEKLRIYAENDTREKRNDGNSRVRLHFNTDLEFDREKNLTFMFQSSKKFYTVGIAKRSGITDYSPLIPAIYNIYFPGIFSDYEENPSGELKFETGGSYTVYVHQNTFEKMSLVRVVKTVAPTSISILWQIPQIIIITIGEIMFAVTGLAFSYSQAPLYLKSVVQAAWLFNSAIGNLLVIFVVQVLNMDKISHELFTFAALMAISMITFAVMAYYYEYKDINKFKEVDL